VVPDIRRRVDYRVSNLLQSYSDYGIFDIIFCRKDLIYFSQNSKNDIVTRMLRLLNPGGYLAPGIYESLSNNFDKLEIIRMSSGVIYKLKH